METDENKELRKAFDDALSAVSHRLESYQPYLQLEEIGTISYVGRDNILCWQRHCSH